MKQKGIQQDRQADSQTGGRKVSSQVFHWAVENEWLDIMEDSAPPPPPRNKRSDVKSSALWKEEMAG
jgi:hypothetical protein